MRTTDVKNMLVILFTLQLTNAKPSSYQSMSLIYICIFYTASLNLYLIKHFQFQGGRKCRAQKHSTTLGQVL